MSRKVILALDEPLDCTDCPLTDLSSMTGDKLCLASNKRWIETQNEYKKPDWCPLMPIEAFEAVREELKKRMEHPERYPKR